MANRVRAEHHGSALVVPGRQSAPDLEASSRVDLRRAHRARVDRSARLDARQRPHGTVIGGHPVNPDELLRANPSTEPQTLVLGEHPEFPPKPIAEALGPSRNALTCGGRIIRMVLDGGPLRGPFWGPHRNLRERGSNRDARRTRRSQDGALGGIRAGSGAIPQTGHTRRAAGPASSPVRVSRSSGGRPAALTASPEGVPARLSADGSSPAPCGGFESGSSRVRL